LFFDLDLLMQKKEGQDGLQEVQKTYGASEGGMTAFDRDLDNLAQYTGCTACVVMVTPQHIICANVGDSRSILVTGGKVVGLSEDHKPNNLAEKKRIVAAGGQVKDNRVTGGLHISRCLGDFDYKENKFKSFKDQMVTCDPDIVSFPRCPEDDFIVLACNGIWESLGNDKCAEAFRKLEKEQAEDEKTSKLVENLFDDLLCKDILDAPDKGADNMTCIFVKFKH